MILPLAVLSPHCSHLERQETSWRSSLWCLSAGSLCHANGTLAVLDTTVLDLHCNFPTQALANLTSLSSLVLQFSRPDQVTPCSPLIAHGCECRLFPSACPL